MYDKYTCEACRKSYDNSVDFTAHNCFEPEEKVNHPSHYTAGGLEVIDILKAKLTAEQLEGFLLGNVIKYTTRYAHKNGVEDLKKAQWYLDYMVKEKASN